MGAYLWRRSRELGRVLTGSFSQACSAARGAAWVNTVCMSFCLKLQGGAEGRELRRGPSQAWLQPPSWARHRSRGLRAWDAEPGECAGAPGTALPRGERSVRGCGSGVGALSTAVGTGGVSPGSPPPRPCLPTWGTQPQGCGWRHR